MNEDLTNDVEWLYNKGWQYVGEQAIQINHKRALKYWGKAAELGHTESQYGFALLHLYGRGIKTDTKKALHWLTQAASQGHEKARFMLGEAKRKSYEQIGKDMTKSC